MNRKLTVLGCVALVLVSHPVQAQMHKPAAGKFAAVPLDSLCRKDGALELTFGSTDHGIAPTHKPGRVNRLAPPELAPFTGIAMNATKYSNRLFSVELSGKVGDKEATRAAVAQLAERFEAAGWLRAKRTAQDDGALTDMPPSESSAVFYAEEGIEGLGGKPGVRLEIMPMFGELYLTCEHTGEMARQIREALGEMPEGTPRPVFVPAGPAFSVSQADCLDVDRREKIMEAMMEDALRPAGYDRLDYEERLADWKIMKLVSTGKLTREALSDKILGLIASPEFDKQMDSALDMLSGLGPLMTAAEKGDRAGLCKMLVVTKEKGEAAARPLPGATGEVTSGVWRATHAMLDAEAKRLGVSLSE